MHLLRTVAQEPAEQLAAGILRYRVHKLNAAGKLFVMHLRVGYVLTRSLHYQQEAVEYRSP